MPVIKPTCIRDLKLRINIVDVVSRVATLKKAGSRFKGLCPFHNEKTPSFHVDPDKGFFKCFGCGQAGDIISFVRETEQLSFTEAIEALGQRFNIPIEYEDGAGPTREERSLRQELFDIHELAAEHYHQEFTSNTPTGEWMRDYWTGNRRFTPELAEEFKVGAAPPADNSLGAALLKRNFTEEAIRQCGLFFVHAGMMLTLGALKPRFRGRLMIPIRDHQGRVVAFTARQTELTPEDDPARDAKYVNSPETPIFSKSHLLFNLDRARTHANEGHPFVLVEGQLDALRCWSVGLKTAIAPQGTSITEGQLQLLRRYHSQIECLFDGDSPGQKAALRFLPLALKNGFEVRFLGGTGETKIDPDLLFSEHGLAAYTRLRETSHTPMQFACASLLPDIANAGAEQKNRVAQSLYEILRHADSAVIRAQFLEEVATLLRLPVDALRKDFATTRQQHYAPARPAQPSPVEGPPEIVQNAHSPEQHLLLMCLHYEDLGKQISQQLPHDWIDSSQLAGTLLNRFLAEFEQDAWPGRDHLDPLLESPEERALVASLLFETSEIDDPKKVIIEGIRQLRTRSLEPRLRQIELALAQTDPNSEGNPISLIKERMEIQRRLRSPIALGPAVG